MFKIVNTEAVASTLLNTIEAERAEKNKLVSENISFPQTDEDKLKAINAFAQANGLELKTELMHNTKASYAFVGRINSEKKAARIAIWSDSNLGRLEISGTKRFMGLGYADLNSTTGFSKLTQD